MQACLVRHCFAGLPGSGERKFLEPALAAARFSASRQHPDGAWDYGESDQPSQRWKDNFHTGYNLCALRSIGCFVPTSEFEPNVRMGFQFYRDHFFREDGAPEYYHDATYPIDVHSVAQSVITLLTLNDLDRKMPLAHAVLNWALANLWNEHGDYFYSQKHPSYLVRIPLHALGPGVDASRAGDDARSVPQRTGRWQWPRPGRAARMSAPFSPEIAKLPGGQPSLRYAMVTPARNEAENIERLLQAMEAQTVRPAKWVIVSDGSTDGTDDIVKKHAAEHKWIELERRPERAERHFAAKVEAFNAGYARLKGVDYDLVGSMDADISFDPDFFAYLLGKFAENPKLGLGGAPFKEEGLEYDFRFSSVEHVSGALQVFRRECFEQIGGYVPVKGGGIDVIAVWSARAQGWETRTFTRKVLSPPSENGHRQRRHDAGEIQGWPKGLRAGGASALGGFSDDVPDDQGALLRWRVCAGLGFYGLSSGGCLAPCRSWCGSVGPTKCAIFQANAPLGRLHGAGKRVGRAVSEETYGRQYH